MKDLINRILLYFISLNLQKKQKILDLFVLLPEIIKLLVIKQYIRQKQKQLINCQCPENLYFFITNSCNMRCKHCFYLSTIEKGASEELSINEIVKVASSLKGVVKSVSFTGGEPFLRKDLLELIAAFIEEGAITSLGIATNGFFVDRTVELVTKLLKKYSKTYVNVQISLDGPEHIHDSIRNFKGAFSNANRTLKYLEQIAAKNNHLTTTINTVVSKYNVAAFNSFYHNLLREYRSNVMWHFLRQDERDVHGIAAKELLCYNDQKSFDSMRQEDKLPDINTIRKLIELIILSEGENILSKWRVLLKTYHIQIAKEGRRAVRCVAPLKGGVLFPDGGVSICEVLRPKANIRNFDLDYVACWKSLLVEDQRNLASSCFCTYPCHLMDSMLYDENTIMKVVTKK